MCSKKEDTSVLNEDTSARSEINKDHTFHPLKREHLSNEDAFLSSSGLLFEEALL